LLHFAENALTLHLFLKGAKSLVNIVVADQNLHSMSNLMVSRIPDRRSRSLVRHRRPNASFDGILAQSSPKMHVKAKLGKVP
jgi:hypothetical protein